MRVYIKKFGTTLVSRPDGREALAAFRPTLANLKKDEKLEIDFEGVVTFTPSWADEFLTPLAKEYGRRLKLLQSNNPSVLLTLQLLEDLSSRKFFMVK